GIVAVRARDQIAHYFCIGGGQYDRFRRHAGRTPENAAPGAVCHSAPTRPLSQRGKPERLFGRGGPLPFWTVGDRKEFRNRTSSNLRSRNPKLHVGRRVFGPTNLRFRISDLRVELVRFRNSPIVGTYFWLPPK